MSPIELSWTAKKESAEPKQNLDQFSLRMFGGGKNKHLRNLKEEIFDISCFSLLETKIFVLSGKTPQFRLDG